MSRACVAALVAAMGCAVPAGATWSPPQKLPDPVLPDPIPPAVAVGPTGAAIVAWNAMTWPLGNSSRAYVSIRPAAGARFSEATVLPGIGNDDVPGVAVLPDGTAVVVWRTEQDADRITYATSFAPSGAQGELVVLHRERDGSQSAPRLVVDGAGRVTAVWETRGLWTATREPDGRWSATELVPDSADTDIRSVRLVATPAGEVVLAWAGRWRLPVTTRPRGATAFPPPVDRAERPGGEFSGVQLNNLVGGPDGTVAVHWSESLPDGGRFAYLRQRPAGGAWSAARPLSARLDGGKLVRARPGELLGLRAGWTDSAEGGFSALSEVRIPDGGEPEAPTPFLTGYASIEDDAPPAVDGQGRVIAAWIGEDRHTGQAAARAVVRSPDGAWGPDVSVSDTEGGAFLASVAAAGPGHAVAAWMRSDGEAWNVEVAGWSPGPEKPWSPPQAPWTPTQALDHTQGWQVDPARSGRVEGARLTRDLRPAWRVDLGAAQPYVVAGHGRVIAVRPVRHGEDGRLRLVALALDDGRELWDAPLEGTPLALVADQHLVVSIAAGAVTARDPATGDERWSTTVYQHSPLPPVLTRDRVIFSAFGHGGHTYGLDRRDGREVWRAITHDPLTVAVAGDLAITASPCEHWFGLDAGAGTTRWAREATCGPTYASSAFDGRWLWVGGHHPGTDEGRVSDPADRGRVVWRFRGGTPAFGDDGLAYRVVDGALVGFDARTLAERWRRSFADPVLSAPLVADGMVLVLDAGGRAHAVDRWTGAVVWEGAAGPAHEPTFPNVPLALGAADGHLVVPTGSGLAVFRALPAPPIAEPPGEGGGGTAGPDPESEGGGGTAGPSPEGDAGHGDGGAPAAAPQAPAAPVPVRPFDLQDPAPDVQIVRPAGGPGSAGEPAPRPATAAYAVAAARLVDRGRTLRLRLRCRAAHGCSGRVALRDLPGRRALGRSARVQGRRAWVEVRLGPRLRRTLARRGRASALVVVRTSAGASRTVVVLRR